MPVTNNDIIHADATEILFDATLDAAAANNTVALPPGADMVLTLADGQRFNITPVSDAAPRAPIALPESWSWSGTLEATPETQRAFDRAVRFLSYGDPRPTARQKARAAAKTLQVIHVKHAHSL